MSKVTKRKMGSKAPMKVKKSELERYKRSASALTTRANVLPGPRMEVGSHDMFGSIHGGAFANTAPDVTLPAIAGNVVLLNDPINGQGAFYQRIGQDVKGHSVHIKGFLSVVGGSEFALQKTTAVRIMVVYDNQTNGAAPIGSDILQDISIAGDTSHVNLGVYAGNKRSGTKRFYTLMDEKIVLSTATASTESAASALANLPEGQRFIDRYIKLKGLPTRFKGNNGTALGSVADIASGGLFLVVFGRCEPDASQPIEFQFNWVSRYKWTE